MSPRKQKTPQASHQAAPSARGRILLAAGRLFADKGFAATSVRDVASVSGVALSSVLYHFGSKEALFFEAIRHFMLDLGQLNGHFAPLLAMDAQNRQAVADALLDAVHSFLTSCHGPRQVPSLIGLYIRVLVEGNDAALGMLLECFAELQSQLPVFCRRVRPAINDQEIAFFQQLLWSQLQYTVVSKRLITYDMNLADYTPEYLAAAARYIARTCCRYLELPEPAAQIPAR